MYGTVARLQVKDGALQDFMNASGSWTRVPAGAISFHVLRTDNNPNELYLFVVFEDEASYRANAEDPQQHAEFTEMMTFLTAEPEWHDGEIIASQSYA